MHSSSLLQHILRLEQSGRWFFQTFGHLSSSQGNLEKRFPSALQMDFSIIAEFLSISRCHVGYNDSMVLVSTSPYPSLTHSLGVHRRVRVVSKGSTIKLCTIQIFETYFHDFMWSICLEVVHLGEPYLACCATPLAHTQSGQQNHGDMHFTASTLRWCLSCVSNIKNKSLSWYS